MDDAVVQGAGDVINTAGALARPDESDEIILPDDAHNITEVSPLPKAQMSTTRKSSNKSKTCVITSSPCKNELHDKQSFAARSKRSNDERKAIPSTSGTQKSAKKRRCARTGRTRLAQATKLESSCANSVMTRRKMQGVHHRELF